MDPDDLIKVLWRRKLIVLFVIALAIGGAFAFLETQQPIYEAESKVALTPGETDELVFFSQINAIVPIYADAVTSRDTILVAETATGLRIDRRDVTVQTAGGQSIFRIKVRSADPEVAARAAQGLTDALFRRAEAEEVGLPAMRLTQAERPRAPTEPVFPLPGVTYLVAAIVGLVAGGGLGLLRESLSNKVEDIASLNRLTGVPSFGEIPDESAVAKVSAPAQLLGQDDLRVVTEAFRDLRTNLMFAIENLGSIVVTSPEGRHGKTTVSFGLAVTMARLGTRALLVDGDLRRGRLAEMLDIPPSPGLHEVMTGLPFTEVTRETGMTGLDVLPSGRLTGDAGEFFDFVFPKVLRDLRAEYDVVIVDATPLVPVNDARIMASFADATLLVVDGREASRQQVRVAMERLSLLGVSPTATVLNRSKKSPRAGYYSYLQTPDTEEKRHGRRRRIFRRKAS